MEDRGPRCDSCHGSAAQHRYRLRYEPGFGEEADQAGERVFCSERCLRNEALRVSGDEAHQLAMLQRRLDDARDDVKDLKRVVKQADKVVSEAQQAFAELMKVAPELDRGRIEVHPPGGQVRQLVANLRARLNQRIDFPARYGGYRS